LSGEAGLVFVHVVASPARFEEIAELNG
jgi:hypothetical protein